MTKPGTLDVFKQKAKLVGKGGTDTANEAALKDAADALNAAVRGRSLSDPKVLSDLAWGFGQHAKGLDSAGALANLLSRKTPGAAEVIRHVIRPH